jgi:hypothetical protein
MLESLKNYKAQQKLKRLLFNILRRKLIIKEVLNNNNKFVIEPYEIKFPLYIFNKQPTSEQLNEVSEPFLNVKQYKRGVNKDYTPIEKTEHTRKKTFIYEWQCNKKFK